MVHHNDREWSFTRWNIHHARNRQPVAGIIDQITRVRIRLSECFTDMNFAALILVLTKSINRIWKDQLFSCRCWRMELMLELGLAEGVSVSMTTCGGGRVAVGEVIVTG